MGLGTLGKVLLFMFCINLGIYFFSPYVGIDPNVHYIFKDDLLHSVVDVDDDFTYGSLMRETNTTIPQLTELEGETTTFSLFDSINNGYNVLKLFLKTTFNVFFSPFALMTALAAGDINIPKQIVLIIFAPLGLLAIIGFMSFMRGKDI